MKKKRHKVIDPAKTRAAAQGGVLNYAAPYPPPEKTCTKCELPVTASTTAAYADLAGSRNTPDEGQGGTARVA